MIIGLVILAYPKFQKTNQIKPAIVPDSVYSAWVPSWDQDRVLKSLASSTKLSSLSPVWYRLDASKQITEVKEGKKEEIKSVAKQQRIKLVPAIFNDFNSQTTSSFLEDQQNYQNQINNLINIAQKQGFAGYDVDFEEINPQDKELFSQFIKYLAANLHKAGLILTVSVHAQSGAFTDRAATKAQDLTELTKSADFIKMMIYDYHNTQTGAGPITPIEEYKQVLRYVSTKVPAEKLIVGLPLYGYKWNKSKNEAIVYQDIIKLVEQNTTKRDDSSSEQVISYLENGISNIVWVEDSQSILFKIKIAREFGIYQFSFWRLGGEDLDLWKKI